MPAVIDVSDEQRSECILAAVEKETPVTVTHRGSDGWVSLKAAFCKTELPAGDAIQLESRTPGFDQLSPGERVGVSFRWGHKKCLFSSVVEIVDANDSSENLKVTWPDSLQILQRRVYQRATPPPGTVIEVRVWEGHSEINAERRKPEGQPVWSGIIEDISVGGIRVSSPQPLNMCEDEPVNCSFALRPQGRPLMINAHFRHCQTRGKMYSVGFQFVGLETRKDKTQLLRELTQTISNFQRADARNRGNRGRGPK